jgi:hypothetical protein
MHWTASRSAAKGLMPQALLRSKPRARWVPQRTAVGASSPATADTWRGLVLDMVDRMYPAEDVLYAALADATASSRPGVAPGLSRQEQLLLARGRSLIIHNMRAAKEVAAASNRTATC